MDNKDLKSTYNSMHAKGASSWFSDGREERETILKMGQPWTGLSVLEIGCGEGDLGASLLKYETKYLGIDYSIEAIRKARKKHLIVIKKYSENIFRKKHAFLKGNFRNRYSGEFDRIVMQGVLEHLNDPFVDLQWIIKYYKPKTVITSSPCFLNPRGIVWMALDMVGAVMSKTDLHYLNPWQFGDWCYDRGYKLTFQDCDRSWGNGRDMLADLGQRIPLALKDGGIKCKKGKVQSFMKWLGEQAHETTYNYNHGETMYATWLSVISTGATMVYRIDIP